MICTMRPANQDQRVATQLLELIVSFKSPRDGLAHIPRSTEYLGISSPRSAKKGN